MQRNHNVFKSDLQEINEIYYDIRIREDIRVDHYLIDNYVFHSKLCLCF